MPSGLLNYKFADLRNAHEADLARLKTTRNDIAAQLILKVSVPLEYLLFSCRFPVTWPKGDVTSEGNGNTLNRLAVRRINVHFKSVHCRLIPIPTVF